MNDDTIDKIHAACEAAVRTNLSVHEFLIECEQGWLDAIMDQKTMAKMDWQKARGTA